ncbi:hypothetical protein DBR11_05960 [Pedobacter sp. HMWF019]|nr:hypothetical protein DBR11_05960 [Pedobacter sp. HMWF019]
MVNSESSFFMVFFAIGVRNLNFSSNSVYTLQTLIQFTKILNQIIQIRQNKNQLFLPVVMPNFAEFICTNVPIIPKSICSPLNKNLPKVISFELNKVLIPQYSILTDFFYFFL